MKKVLIPLSIMLFIGIAGYLYAQGMMRGGSFPMHHYFMHAQNLKILERQQAQQAMIHFSESLKVTCNFCHHVDAKVDADSIKKGLRIKGDFALEDSEAITDKELKKNLGHKIRAREMLKMVNYDNVNFLNWTHSSGRKADQVNCWICHRGTNDKMVFDHKKEHKDFTDLY
jgi:hypothetical protein